MKMTNAYPIKKENFDFFECVNILILKIFYFFTSSLIGFFVLSVFLYTYFYFKTLISPFSLGELVFWFYSLDAIYKGILVASTITLFGVYITSRIAQENWRDQKKSEMQLGTISHLDSFYSVYYKNLNNIRGYFIPLKKILEVIDDYNVPIQSKIILFNKCINEHSKYVEGIEKLTNISEDLLRLKSININVLDTIIDGELRIMNTIDLIMEASIKLKDDKHFITIDKTLLNKNNIIANISMPEIKKYIGHLKLNELNETYLILEKLDDDFFGNCMSLKSELAFDILNDDLNVKINSIKRINRNKEKILSLHFDKLKNDYDLTLEKTKN